MTWTPPQFLPLLQDRLAPWLTEETDPYGDHANFLQAVAAMAQPLYGLVADSGDDPDDPSWVPGWGSLFDIDIAPFQYLQYLAQLVGVPASSFVGADDATARQIIRAEQGQQRGTAGAVISAAQRFLSGTQSVFLQERTAANGTADPYHFILQVKPSQVIDATQLTAAVNAVKPAGVQWTLLQLDAFTWSSAIHDWSVDTMTWNQTANTQP